MTAPIASGGSESPGGPCTHWKAPPCHGARRNQPFACHGSHELNRPRHSCRIVSSSSSGLQVPLRGPVVSLPSQQREPTATHQDRRRPYGEFPATRRCKDARRGLAPSPSALFGFSRCSLRVDPVFRSRQLDRHIRKE